MNDASFAKRRLSEASHLKDSARRLALLFATAAAALFVLLLTAITDYWLILPMSVRIGGTILLVAILAAGAYRLLRSFRAPTGLKEAALDAESQKQEIGCELSTAAEYISGERKPTQEYEKELAGALEAKAAAHLKSLNVPYWNRPVRPAVFFGALALCVVLFGAVLSGGFTAFRRAAAPWSDVPYTRVQVLPGNVEIPVGKDVDIKSVFSGRVPKEAQFQWQDEKSAKWQFASLARNQQGEYIYPLKNVRTALNYRVAGNDAVSAAFKVQPYIPPEVQDWQVELKLPDYTKRPSIIQNTPDISVLRGSTASIQISPNTKLSKARLRFEELPPIDMSASDTGFWNAQLQIKKDTKFWIELADEKGHTGGNETPFQITALADQAPKLEISEPGQDIRAEATNTIPIKISVTDDYGIQEIKLAYNKLGSPEQYITAKRDNETNTEYTAEIPLSSLGLEEFELVAYHAEASDNNTLDGPGIGKSEVYFIEITNQEGGKCKSQGKSQRVNLLVIQKQIIADTTALAAKPTPDQFDDLAKRQKDAAEFGRLYTKALGNAGEAAAEMQAAVADMEKAQGALEKQLRASALPPAESSLAHLYKVLKLMPQLQDLPTRPPNMQQQQQTNRPPVLNVVLDAIKKKKKEDPNHQELTEALQEAQQLRDEQGSLNIGVQNSGDSPASGNAESQLVRASSESQSQAESKAPVQQAKSNGKSGQKSGNGKNGAGKNGEPKNGEPKNGEPKPQDGKPGEPKEPKDNQQLAEKQNELSKEATALAEKLARLAGKSSRLGHNAGSQVKNAAAKMGAAAGEMAKGNMQAAGTKGAEINTDLDSAIATLDRLVNDRPGRIDLANEESPKDYEMIIAEYFKKLSHEE